jgi:uncharacterized phage-associated protein
MFEFSNVTCLDLLSHLWTKYGTIKPAELQKNFQSMYTPWNTTEPCLDLLSHLWTKYGTIKPAELQKNFQSMYTPWNTTEPIESVFLQLDEAIAFSVDGNDPISEAAAV